MAKYVFRSGFWLNLGGDPMNPERVRFEAGEQDVPDHIAGHWFLAEMGERVDGTGVGEPAADTSEKDTLRAEASALGIAVDGRWSVSRLKSEIDAKKIPEPEIVTEPEGEAG